jgi:hypothetical protein
LRRRTFHRLAAAGLFSAVLADLPDSGAPLEGVEAFAAALAGYPDVPGGLPESTRFDIATLAASVASAKRPTDTHLPSSVYPTGGNRRVMGWRALLDDRGAMQHQHADEQPPCVSCNGRRWKYVTPRRGLVLARPGEPVAQERARAACSRCGGSGREGLAA